MSRTARWSHTPALKARMILTALKGGKRVADLPEQFCVHVGEITQCAGSRA